MAVTTTRTIVRDGIAAYFGGTLNTSNRSYQNGPLVSFGLGTVRAGFGKRLNMQDYVNGMADGRGMGCYMVVELPSQQEGRSAQAGAPVVQGGIPVGGGVKLITYHVSLQCFHMAQKAFAEDAQADIDALIEAILNQIRIDRTLGGICTDAGETRYGIRVNEGHPGVDGRERTGTWFTIEFEARVQIVA